MQWSKLDASDYAAWWGAIVATIVFVWELVKWRSSGPRLQGTVFQRSDEPALDFSLIVSNTGDRPATIQDVRLRCFERRLLLLKREFELGDSYDLSGNDAPPLTLQPGDLWQVSLSPKCKISLNPKHPLVVRIEIQESHRSKPYRFPADSRRFSDHLLNRTA
jgi:hypothetical protein